MAAACLGSITAPGLRRPTLASCSVWGLSSMRWTVLWSDNQTTRLNKEDMVRYCIDRIHGDFETPHPDSSSDTESDDDDEYTDPEYYALIQAQFIENGHDCVLTKMNDVFADV
jgi:hypothetical protein